MKEKNKEYYINRILNKCKEIKFKKGEYTPTIFDIGRIRLSPHIIIVFGDDDDEEQGSFLRKKEFPLTKEEYTNIFNNICI